jgi:aspartate kinase
VVIPGFYGSLPNGVIKVMSRGGSDITGSIVANAFDVDVYENWTDVSGFYVADPRIIKDPVQIPRITYSELRQMSYMGANVLHDDAVFPVRQKNIPINVRNTNHPENPGTMIMNDCSELDEQEPPHVITGITGKQDFTVITMVKSHVSAEAGFLRKVLAVFEKFQISIESVPVTVDTFSIVVQTKKIERYLYEIVAELKQDLHLDDIQVESQQAMLAVVGRAMRQMPKAIYQQFISEERVER